MRRSYSSNCPLRRTAPWLVTSLVPLNLFDPRIAKRFEAGAEEDRAVAQALKLGCRLAPPSHLRLVKPNRIQRKIYRRKSAHTSMSPTPGVLEKPDASKERPINQNEKTKGNQKMNSICSSTDRVTVAVPVLGLDVAKKSVQAELRNSSNKVRFGFANNAKGFAQLARILKEHDVPKVWAGLEARSEEHTSEL